MNNFKVSVVVLTYYHEKYLKKALDSILSQKCNFNYEIQIGDDCSKDGTIEIIKKYKELYPKMIFYHQNESNNGISSNLYDTMCRCRGEYITILAGDDYFIDDDKLKKQVEFLDNHEEYLAHAVCLESRWDNEEKYFDINPIPKFRNKEITLDMFLNSGSFSTGGLMFRNEFLSNEGREYYKLITQISKMVDDLPFCILLLKKGRVYNSDELMYAHRVFKDTKNNNNYNSRFSRFKKFKINIDLLNALDKYYDNEIDFSIRYKKSISIGFLSMLLDHNYKEFNEVMNTIPNKYRTVILKGILGSFFVGIKYVLKRI